MVDTGVGDDDEDDDNKESKTPIYTLHAMETLTKPSLLMMYSLIH